MNLTAEITLYPLQQSFLPVIKQVVERLNSATDVRVQTFPTATILYGESPRVFKHIQQAIEQAAMLTTQSVFIVKYLPNYEAI